MLKVEVAHLHLLQRSILRVDKSNKLYADH